MTVAKFREADNRWEIETDQGDRVTARFLITGIGCISAGQVPDIKGRDSFAGDWYHTGAWPHEGVDLTGKRVGVIGTGSSGVQSIPVIAEQADQLFVFQRTPQFSVPARHDTVDRDFLEEVKANYGEILEKARWSLGGFPIDPNELSALEVSDEERQASFEAGWAEGGFKFFFASLHRPRNRPPRERHRL